jgi:hypothetical protein
MVGKMLKTYKSGKLPKALKMLPHLKNWEEVLWLTRPDEWSPSATFACTRIFASNLNVKMAQVDLYDNAYLSPINIYSDSIVLSSWRDVVKIFDQITS